MIPQVRRSLPEQMLFECDAMARHAFGSGLTIPRNILTMMKNCGVYHTADKTASKEKNPPNFENLNHLLALHSALSKLVSPAKPRTLLLIFEESQKRHWLTFLGPVPIIRSLIVVAVLFLFAWIGFSLSPDVTGTVDFANGHSLPLLMDELFIFFAAGIGATFSILFQLNRYVVRGLYDPIHDASYWTRLVLGIIAGVILAMLIPLDKTGPLQELTKPTLSLLGGFSVTVVYRILTRLIAAVESLVKGDTQSILENQIQMVKTEHDAAQLEERSKLAAGLIDLKGKIAGGTDMKEILDSINASLNQLLPQDYTDQASSAGS